MSLNAPICAGRRGSLLPDWHGFFIAAPFSSRIAGCQMVANSRPHGEGLYLPLSCSTMGAKSRMYLSNTVMYEMQ